MVNQIPPPPCRWEEVIANKPRKNAANLRGRSILIKVSNH